MFPRRTAILPCLRAALLLILANFSGDEPSTGFFSLLRGASAQNASGNAQNASGNETKPPCPIACCNDKLRMEARLACAELSRWGSMDFAAIPNLWQANAIRFCTESCGNCTVIARAIYDQCRFYLMTRMDMNLAIQYCRIQEESFLKGRCPSVCNTTKEHCGSEDGQDCNVQCGNYVGCECVKQRGRYGEPDSCTGKTVLEGKIPGKMGLRHSCDLTPRDCMNHHTDVHCGKYRHCAANLCLVKNISCPIRDTCEEAGVCAPTDGKCYYTFKDDGSSCDDGLFYTHDDTCDEGKCIGWEDKCLRYDVDCKTTNPCLVPEGTCDQPTGACVFVPQPDGTACASSPGGTNDGTCDFGVCRRTVLDPCTQKSCPRNNPCLQSSTCSSETGEAVCRNERRPEGVVCDDGNPATHNDQCIEGRCVGDAYQSPQFQFLGDGICADNQGKPVQRYFGDVMDKEECELQCANDPECTAFSYGFHTCNIHGTRRAEHPMPQAWQGKSWLLGNISGEILSFGSVQKVLGPEEGEPQMVCYRKASTGDEPPDPGNFWKDFVLGTLISILALLPGGWWFCQKYNKNCRLCPRCRRRPRHVDMNTGERAYIKDGFVDEVVTIGEPNGKDPTSKISAMPHDGLEPLEDDAAPMSEDADFPVAEHTSGLDAKEAPDPRGEVVHASDANAAAQ